MTHKLLHVSSINPNDSTGGGGCICSPIKQQDCKPPYVIFYGNDMENVASPHVVACLACLEYATEKAQGEVLDAGEQHEIQGTYADDPRPRDAQRSNPLVDYGALPEPVLDAESWDDDEDIPAV